MFQIQIQTLPRTTLPDNRLIQENINNEITERKRKSALLIYYIDWKFLKFIFNDYLYSYSRIILTWVTLVIEDIRWHQLI